MGRHEEAVDLEALYRGLEASSGTTAPTVERFELALLRAPPTANGPNSNDFLVLTPNGPRARRHLTRRPTPTMMKPITSHR